VKGSEKFAFLVRESESGAHKRERERVLERFLNVWCGCLGREQNKKATTKRRYLGEQKTHPVTHEITFLSLLFTPPPPPKKKKVFYPSHF
jgi:hypothetical protein